MDHEWPVTVVDDTGADVAGARVCLVEASAVAEQFPFPTLAATHDDKGGGRYEPTSPIAASVGDWVLALTRPRWTGSRC